MCLKSYLSTARNVCSANCGLLIRCGESQGLGTAAVCAVLSSADGSLTSYVKGYFLREPSTQCCYMLSFLSANYYS